MTSTCIVKLGLWRLTVLVFPYLRFFLDSQHYYHLASMSCCILTNLLSLQIIPLLVSQPIYFVLSICSFLLGDRVLRLPLLLIYFYVGLLFLYYCFFFPPFSLPSFSLYPISSFLLLVVRKSKDNIKCDFCKEAEYLGNIFYINLQLIQTHRRSSGTSHPLCFERLAFGLQVLFFMSLTNTTVQRRIK